MPLNVALTGATGFVGRNVVAELLAAGHRVTALVRDLPGAKLPNAVTLVGGDLQSNSALDELTVRADVVIHVAGLICAVNKQEYFVANEQGSRDLARAAVRNGVKRFVQVSSLSAREPELSAYGKSKLAGETALQNIPGQMSKIILRPPAVYGPGDRATLPLLKALTQTIAILPGRADAKFSLIHVCDLARIIVEAVSSERTGVVELDDGTKGGHNWSELVRISSEVESRSVTPVFAPKLALLAVAIVAETYAAMRQRPSMISRDKINELYHLDWVARGEGWPLKYHTGFAQGFTETLAWYRREGWLPQSTTTRILT